MSAGCITERKRSRVLHIMLLKNNMRYQRASPSPFNIDKCYQAAAGATKSPQRDEAEFQKRAARPRR